MGYPGSDSIKPHRPDSRTLSSALHRSSQGRTLAVESLALGHGTRIPLSSVESAREDHPRQSAIFQPASIPQKPRRS